MSARIVGVLGCFGSGRVVWGASSFLYCIDYLRCYELKVNLSMTISTVCLGCVRVYPLWELSRVLKPQPPNFLPVYLQHHCTDTWYALDLPA
jgi:hypothetical protein